MSITYKITESDTSEDTCSVTPTAMPTPETPTDESWGGKCGDGYKASYIAAGSVNTGGTISWADIQPAQNIQEIEVDDLDPKKIMNLLREHDGDIDGNSSAGTSTVIEGEEKFTFGASYSGTQGVSVSEVSGVSASIVQGKRVTWTVGDTFSRTEDGDAITKMNVGKNITEIDANLIEYNRSAKVWNQNTYAGASNISAMSGVSSNHAFSTAHNTANIAISRTTANISGHNFTASVSAAATTYNVAAWSNTVNVCTGDINITNVGISSITKNFTNLTAALSSNIFFNIAANSIETYQAAVLKVGTKINTAEMLIRDTRMDTSKVLTTIKESNIEFMKKKIAFEKNELFDKECDLASANIGIESAAGEIRTESVKNKISVSNAYISA